MPTYRYKVRDRFGRLLTGTIDGESREKVAAHFRNLSFTPVGIEEEIGVFERFRFVGIFLQHVRLEELVVFTRQLMTLQRAGVPLLASLESIREQCQNRYFREVIFKISRGIESGENFSSMLSKFPSIFSDIYVSMVRAGEASGTMDEVLDRLGLLLEHELDLRMKVRQALRYPVLVSIVLSVAFIAAVVFIIPRFASLFSGFNMALPLPTRFLMWLNFIFVRFGIYMVIIITGLGLLMRYLVKVRVQHLRPFIDRFKLKIPVLGQLFLRISMSRFSRTCSMLIASGIPLLNTLTITKGVVGNRVIADSIEVIKEGIGKGEGMAIPMKLTGLFPAIVIQMVKIGEDTGKIDYLLLRISEYYDTQIDYTVKNLALLIEPFLLGMLGILVLILALGVFMPMWNLIQLYKI